MLAQMANVLNQHYAVHDCDSEQRDKANAR